MGELLGPLGAIAGIAQLVSLGSAFWLGGRLLRRGWGARAMPELLLGGHLFLTLGLASLLLTVVALHGHSRDTVVPHVPGLFGLAVTGNAFTIVGLICALAFNAEVFHGGSRPARIAVVVGSVAMWVGFYWLFRDGDLSSALRYDAGYYPLAATMLVADAWIVGEALHFRAQLRRRLALGLCEPIVVERVLLWAVGALARAILILMAPVTNALIQAPETRAAATAPLLVLAALLIAAACAAFWLMLAPSDGYKRWVERRYAARAAG